MRRRSEIKRWCRVRVVRPKLPAAPRSNAYSVLVQAISYGKHCSFKVKEWNGMELVSSYSYIFNINIAVKIPG